MNKMIQQVKLPSPKVCSVLTNANFIERFHRSILGTIVKPDSIHYYCKGGKKGGTLPCMLT
uniref:Uncharacterized protein n=1 Tax=Arundo donax TaxID=35708 RepID=A0A0A9CXJ4_ARUDO